MRRSLQPVFEYWRTLYAILRGQPVLERTLDVPLQEAVIRSRWAAGWTSALLLLTILYRQGTVIQTTLHRVPVDVGLKVTAVAFAAVTSLLLAGGLGYGFLRLYTLVTHVMTVNIFKVRGQRLRLLNVQTSVLSLAVPVLMGIAAMPDSPLGGWLIVGAFSLFAIALLARGYNLIFHRERLSGLWLLAEGTVVTWFVLAIGTLAITVAVAVMALFLLLILRIFKR